MTGFASLWYVCNDSRSCSPSLISEIHLDEKIFADFRRKNSARVMFFVDPTEEDRYWSLQCEDDAG